MSARQPSRCCADAPTPPGNARERQRAFALLIRQGFETDIAYDAVRLHEGGRRGGDDG